ncbi:hypothetical protein [Flaviflagellibacter deserti]|uniref:Uncharacterized protein n=1 Tax=Flaviflagellibacter deserti TaxID=2267266 RepID=A0ABV9Z4F0_9HYPH
MVQTNREHDTCVRPPEGAVPHARSTLDFAGLHDHTRMPARFFGRLIAARAADLRSL